MHDATPLGLPLPPHVKHSKADYPNDEMTGDDIRDLPYASACGSLRYTMVATCPNIAYAEGVVSRYMSNLSKSNWQAVKCILRYLKDTMSKCINYD